MPNSFLSPPSFGHLSGPFQAFQPGNYLFGLRFFELFW
ncbi:MAG: hypothetical protein OP8BY_0543 [Candidatus Saccharicenans subterraneus]|uniref:Uncharacterized protein n=1 Tax=Candidatus Saccharicenans subterraneus TaxID=2508984 RepID=A0A3E2BKI3_9BACT|nr:MAG: hypothetical protein OP8BY_0543 [Candidatus Saccharicenans subterraneum]